MRDCITDFFFDQVERRPEAQAVIHSGNSWSYGSLASLSNSVAAYLVDAGVKKGDRVALVMANSPEYVAVFYGIQIAGCCVVALNIQEPAEVLSSLISHCDAKGVFIDESHRNYQEILTRVCGITHFVVPVKFSSPQNIRSGCGMWDQILVGPTDSVAWRNKLVRERDLAAIVYTSGTTGSPKGVMLSHLNLASNTKAITKCINIQPTHRVLNVLPFYYSFGNSVLHTHLCTGATIFLQDNIAFPRVIWKAIEDLKITSFYGVPSTFALLLARKAYEGADVSVLQYIAQAGGAMSIATIRLLQSVMPHSKIYIMYGQTEATARLTCLPPDMLDRKLGSVGKGIPGMEISIRAADGSIKETNSIGEVWVRGASVMSGYWGNEQASNQVLRGGWLCTGDNGYLDADGFLYIEGRRSDMIKTGANRVNPLEIEDVIAALPGVKEVGVYGIPDDVLGDIIAAEVVCEPGFNPSVQDIQRHCLNNLASYKVPKLISFTEFLPKTASGKVKRHEMQEKAKEVAARDK